MLLKEQLLAEHRSELRKIIAEHNAEFMVLAGSAGCPNAGLSEDSSLSASEIPISSSRFEESRLQEDCAAGPLADHSAKASRRSSKNASIKAAAQTNPSIQLRSTSAPRQTARIQLGTGAKPGAKQQDIQPLAAADGSDIVGIPQSCQLRGGRPNGRGARADNAAAKAVPPQNSAGNTSDKPAEAADNHVDETLICNETQIQDQSCFVGDDTYTVDALNQYKRRRARRRTGRRIQKRPYEAIEEFADVVKWARTDDEKCFLVEYYQILQRQNDASEAVKAAGGEEELAKRKSREKAQRRKLRKARMEARRLQDEAKKELDAVRQLRESLQMMEAQKSDEAKDREALANKRIAAELEELGRLRAERAEEKKALEEYKKIIADQNRLIENGFAARKQDEPEAVGSSKAIERPLARNCFEAATFTDKQIGSGDSKITSIGNLFRAARAEHMAKQSQLAHAASAADKAEVRRPLAAFNSVLKKPQKQMSGPDESKQRALQRQALYELDKPSSAKKYIAKTPITFYSAEEEFECDEKKFEPAAFTKDPRLMYIVKKQNHSEIRRFFGNQADIDVEAIFNNVENVTNASPNKLVRRH
ncbi:hypothetical protein PAPHI01_2604 [Pancytospora philotis]|nr:hypothetical protein PAPHI01_2604 [Pancytospora philotis]